MASSRAVQVFALFSRRYFLTAILSAGLMLAGYPLLHAQSKPAAVPPAIVVAPVTRSFLFWGDIRFTDPAQCDKSDPDVRQSIVQEMASLDPHPDLAILTGDVVYHGHDNRDWE